MWPLLAFTGSILTGRAPVSAPPTIDRIASRSRSSLCDKSLMVMRAMCTSAQASACSWLSVQRTIGDGQPEAEAREGASHATPGQSREGCPGPTMSRRMPAQEEERDRGRKPLHLLWRSSPRECRDRTNILHLHCLPTPVTPIHPSRSQPFRRSCSESYFSRFFNYLPQLRADLNPGWHSARTVGQRADAQT